MNTLPNFQDDYLISWDFHTPDLPCITVMALRRDPDRGTMILCEQLGTAYTKSGVVSLRQLLEICRERQRLEDDKKDDVVERMRKYYGEGQTDDQGTTESL